MHARARALLRACGLSVALGALALPSGVQAQAVHKCRVNGQLVYQQAPCAHASQRETLSEDGISVIGGNPAPARAEPAPTPRPRAKPAPEPSPAATRRTVSDEQRQEERAERERSGLCVKLRDALERIDGQARVRSTADLAERRRFVKGELWRLRCEGGR